MASKNKMIPIPENIETSYDRIYFSYLSDEVDALLTDQERKHRERIDVAWHHMVTRKSAQSAAEHIELTYSVSRATAYRVVRDALQIFGDVVKTSKDAKRLLLWEYSLKGLDECMAIGDMRAYAAILKNMSSFEGLNLEDKTFDGEAITAHTYLIQIGTAQGQELSFNVDKIDELEDAKYADVVEAVENMSISLDEMEEMLDRAEKKGKKPKKDEKPQ